MKIEPLRNLLIVHLLLCGAVYCHADVIVDWNRVASDVLLADLTAQNPGMASRSMALVNIAMYDAVNGVHPQHQQFYDYPASPSGNASAEVAAVQAGYRVLSSIYPAQQAMLDANRETVLSSVPDDGREAGMLYGDAVGQHVVATRSSDGFDNMVSYMPTDQPGAWQPDPMNPTQQAWGPEWGQLATFGISDAASIPVPMVPSLNSPQYTAAFNEVKELGALNSSIRTDEQTEIGLFWAYDRVEMGTPHRMLNQVLRVVADNEDNDLSENARLFAMTSTAVADAGVVAWDAKFGYDFWRPVTGIREAEADGNPATIADPNWIPLGAPGGTLSDGTIVADFTPPFPTYVSGHASFGGALFQSLTNFYGTDDIAFTLTSDEMPGSSRSYGSFSAALDELGRSRVYLGIHWDFDDFIARDVGARIANDVAASHFQAVPEPQTFSLLAFGLLFVSRARRRRACALSDG